MECIRLNFCLKFLLMQYLTGQYKFVVAIMKNEVLLLGANVEFQCDIEYRSTEDIQWIRHMYYCHKDTTCYDSSILYPKNKTITNLKYDVHLNEKMTTLSIKTDNLTNADSYYCIINDTNVLDSSDLVILEKQPQCSYFEETVMENSTLGLYCKVNVSGNWIPNFKCTSTKNKDISITYNLSSKFKYITVLSDEGVNMVNIYQINSVWNITADYAYNNETFTCDICNWTYVGYYHQLGFQSPDIKAANRPSYAYSWTSSPANILFGPKFVNITNNFDDFVCTSIGNPTPTYRWAIMNNRKIIGPVLHKSLLKEIGSYDVTCVAENVINGVPFSDHKSLSVNITQLIGPPVGDQVADQFTVAG